MIAVGTKVRINGGAAIWIVVGLTATPGYVVIVPEHCEHAHTASDRVRKATTDLVATQDDLCVAARALLAYARGQRTVFETEREYRARGRQLADDLQRVLDRETVEISGSGTPTSGHVGTAVVPPDGWIPVCTQADHDALKLDDVAWAALPIPRGGDTQEIPAGEDPSAEPAELHDVRNCSRCGSTISRFRCYTKSID